MNEPMTETYNKKVGEFKTWSDNGSERINDSKSGVSARPRYERPYEPPMSTAMNDMLDK